MLPLLTMLISSRAIVFALVVSRFAGFVLTSPFPGEDVSTTQRIGFVLVLSWIGATFASATGAPTTMGAHLVFASVSELVCGAAIGLVFRLVLSAGDMVASMFSHATGLSSPSVFNPGSGAHETPAGRVVTMIAATLSLGVGAHRVALAYLLESLRSLPVGRVSAHVLGAAAAPMLVQLTGEALTVGVRLAMPFVAVSLVIQLGLAMIARAAPSLQIFQFGLTIMLGSGALTFVAVLPDLIGELSAHLGSLGDRCERLFSVMSALGPGP